MNRQGAGGASPATNNMSVDAKLAAQAAAGAAGNNGGGNPAAGASARAVSCSSSNPNTPTVQQQPQPQQHGQYNHHPQHPQQGVPSQRSKKEEYLLLSLPSRDSALTAHHNHWDTGDDAGFYGSDEAEDSDWTNATMCPPLTNRGHKLAPGARFVRKGRLGGWENRELLEGNSKSASRSASSLIKPAMDGADSLLIDEVKRPQAGLPGGKDVYPITPNLTFVPSSSTAAARPDREAPAYSFLPGPNSPTSPSALSPRKRKKVYSSYTGLASTSGSTSNHTSAPVKAYLPAPPQNPIELVMSPLVTRTFSPRNNVLEKLALHPTDLIERDLPLLKALTRVVDVLRGTTVAGLDGSLGLPFSNDVEPVVQPDLKDKATEEAEQEIEAEIEAAREAEADYLQSKQDIDKGDDSATGTLHLQPNEEENEGEGGRAKKRRRTASLEAKEGSVNASGSVLDSTTPAISGAVVDASVGTTTVAAAEAAEAVQEASAAPAADMPVVNGTEAVKLEASLKGIHASSDTAIEGAKAAEEAMTSNEVVHDKAELGVVAETSTAAEAAAAGASLIAEGSATASRRNSPSSANGQDEDDESMADTAMDDEEGSVSSHNPSTRLPASLQRIANPAPYVSSLFVSPNDVHVAIPPGAPGSVPGQPDAPVPGGYQWIDLLLPKGPPRFVYRNPPGKQAPQQPEASTSGSSSAAEGAAATMSGQPSRSSASTPVSTYPEYRKLTPAEQQEAVHLCTQELTKFLSDTLEYRDRLAEIRDSILGVEKRRKGVWTMARSYAHQMLWEEEQDRIAQGM